MVMRVLGSLLVAGIATLGALSVGCGGDDQQERMQQAQRLQQAQEQAQESSTASAERSAGGRPEPEQETADRQDQAAPQDQAEAQRRDDGAPRDPLFAEAEAAYQAWSDSLRTFVLDAEVEVDFGGLETQVQTTISMQVEPLMILMSIDGSAGMSIGGGEAEQAAVPVQMQMLMSEDSAYLSMPELGGWVDVSEDFEELLGGLTALLGADPEEFANPDGLGQAFGCVDVVGGAISVDRYAGEQVWMVDCEIDVESLNAASAQALTAMGLTVVDSGIETMRLRMAISQATGAPLLLESYLTLADPLGVMDGDGDDSGDEAEAGLYISQSATLRSWNQPIDFPTPEPLIDGSLFDVLEEPGSDESSDAEIPSGEPPELLAPAELLELAADWAASLEELQLEFDARALIDGDQRRASTLVRISRPRGSFETSVRLDESSGFRLLWTRDGIWTSEGDIDGRPAWTPSSPALLGFAGKSVDQFLAEPGWLDPEPLRALLDIAWLARTIEGGGPPVYELGIETGPLVPGDEHFDRVAELLKADTAELLAASVEITSIARYSTIVTLIGEAGAMTRQVTTAEFETSAGRVVLEAIGEVGVDVVLEFSKPPQ